jgi:hypothetical protein
MLQTLSEQTEASKNFRSELQMLGSQLANIFQSMEKGSNEISLQISELTVHMAAEAKETQRMLSVTSNNMRSELQQIGGQLGTTLSNATEKYSGEIVNQIVQLKDRLAADAKDSHQHLDTVNNSVCNELQQIGGQLGTIFNATEKGNDEISTQFAELKTHVAAVANESHQRMDTANNYLCSELQQLGGHLSTIFNATEKGSDEIATRITELKGHMAADSNEAYQRLDTASNNVRSELQQLGSQLGAIFNVMEKAEGKVPNQVSELMVHMAADIKGSENNIAPGDK